jgi:hypothetical protein
MVGTTPAWKSASRYCSAFASARNLLEDVVLLLKQQKAAALLATDGGQFRAGYFLICGPGDLGYAHQPNEVSGAKPLKNGSRVVLDVVRWRGERPGGQRSTWRIHPVPAVL